MRIQALLKRAAGYIVFLTALFVFPLSGFAAQDRTTVSKNKATVTKSVKKSVTKKSTAKKQNTSVKKNTTVKKKASTTKARKNSSKVVATAATGRLVAAEGKRAEAQKKIKELESSVKENKEAKSKLEKELAQTAKDISSARRNIRKLQQNSRKVQTQLNNQNKKIATLRKNIEIERSIIDEANRQRLELLSASSKPAWMQDQKEAFRNNAVLAMLAKQSDEAVKKLARQEKELERIVAASEKSKKNLSALADKEIAERNQLLKDRNKRQKAAVALQNELNRQQKDLKSLKRDERRLNNLIARIELQEKQKEAQRKKQLARAKSKNAKQENIKTVKTASLSGAVMPVNGSVAARFGQTRKVSGNTGKWQGVVFSVKGIQPVKAIKAGKVVFADYLRGYGNMVIVDHGNGFFSVYGNNAEIQKDIGDKVKAGETISTVGTQKDGLTVLYFELRNKGRAIDPSKWLKL